MRQKAEKNPPIKCFFNKTTGRHWLYKQV